MTSRIRVGHINKCSERNGSCSSIPIWTKGEFKRNASCVQARTVGGNVDTGHKQMKGLLIYGFIKHFLQTFISRQTHRSTNMINHNLCSKRSVELTLKACDHM